MEEITKPQNLLKGYETLDKYNAVSDNMKNVAIAGVEIVVKFCDKINKQSIELSKIAKQPVVNIYKSENRNTYTVNILTYLPDDIELMRTHLQLMNSRQLNEVITLKDKKVLSLNSGVFLDEEGKIYLSYEGVSKIDTSVSKLNNLKTNNMVSCRVFNLHYYDEVATPNQYDLYHIQFEYKFKSSNQQEAEAIIVHNVNEDPETDRGTVSVPVTDDQ